MRPVWLGPVVAPLGLPRRHRAGPLVLLRLLAAPEQHLVGRVPPAVRRPMIRRPLAAPGAPARQAARAALVQRVERAMAADLGRPPADAELVRLLARSPAVIGRLRRLPPSSGRLISPA